MSGRRNISESVVVGGPFDGPCQQIAIRCVHLRLEGRGACLPKQLASGPREGRSARLCKPRQILKPFPTRLLAVAAVALSMRAVDEIELDSIAEESGVDMTEAFSPPHITKVAADALWLRPGPCSFPTARLQLRPPHHQYRASNECSRRLREVSLSRRRLGP